MNLLYIFLTFLMFLDCVILVLLVLVQLPKKEAGAGVAFGGGATDALFGAGSGNVLTKITKWAGGIFFGLAVIMAMVAAQQQKNTGGASLTEALTKSATASPAPKLAPTTSSNSGLQPLPLLSNVPTAKPVAPSATTATNK